MQRGLHASDMRQLLQSFMEHYPHDAKMDDFSQKESAIIHTLYRRGLELEEKRRSASRFSLKGNISSERTAPRPVPSMLHQQSQPRSGSGSSASPEDGAEPTGFANNARTGAVGEMPPPSTNGGAAAISGEMTPGMSTSTSGLPNKRGSLDLKAGDPSQMRSPVTAFLSREGGLSGGQPSSLPGGNMTSSPEDDQAQRL